MDLAELEHRKCRLGDVHSHTDDSLTFHCLKQKYGASGGNMKTFIDYEEGVF